MNCDEKKPITNVSLAVAPRIETKTTKKMCGKTFSVALQFIPIYRFDQNEILEIRFEVRATNVNAQLTAKSVSANITNCLLIEIVHIRNVLKMVKTTQSKIKY